MRSSETHEMRTLVGFERYRGLLRCKVLTFQNVLALKGYAWKRVVLWLLVKHDMNVA